MYLLAMTAQLKKKERTSATLSLRPSYRQRKEKKGVDDYFLTGALGERLVSRAVFKLLLRGMKKGKRVRKWCPSLVFAVRGRDAMH